MVWQWISLFIVVKGCLLTMISMRICHQPRGFLQFWWRNFLVKAMSSTLTIITQVQSLWNTFCLTTHIYVVPFIQVDTTFSKMLSTKSWNTGMLFFIFLQVACKYRAHKDKASGHQKVVYMLSACHQPSMELGNNQDNVKEPICIE